MIKNQTTNDQFEKWLNEKENKNLEFKLAEDDFDYDHKLADYCAAISNMDGGELILGIEDKLRTVCGTKAFSDNWNELSNQLLQKIGIRVDVEEFFYNNNSVNRILIFHIPKHLPGQPVLSNKKYLMRAGESLVPMDAQTLQAIFAEVEPDFSCIKVEGFKIQDIDEIALNNFKKLWSEKQKKKEYQRFSSEKTLRAIGAMDDRGLNYAALILFGQKHKIDELLPGAEIIFEWRQSNKVRHDFRKDWREPFFKIYDEIWNSINARNIRFPYHEGFIQKEIYAFNEESVRESVLNAVAHRDYHIYSASIFIKANPDKIVIQSPGGFIKGINPDNILEKSEWRNRRIAEIFQLAGLVERSGQGMDTIFGNSIREGKGLPDFTGSDEYSVLLNIPTKVKDPEFVLFLEKIVNEKHTHLFFEEIYELEKIREKQTVKEVNFKDKFFKLGIIEQVGKTRGARYILSHRFYSFKERPGVYTKISGLSRDEKKQLIIKHISKNKKGYAKDLKDVFTELKSKDISNILQELKRDGKIIHEGSDRDGYWITVPLGK